MMPPPPPPDLAEGSCATLHLRMTAMDCLDSSDADAVHAV